MNEWWEDFVRFRKFITPRVMPVVFWIGVGIAVITGIISIVEGVLLGSARLVFLGLVSLFLGPLFVRILCELVLTFFRHKE
ncbi:MAG: DUF4282 domain-containing protein [Candidatus Bipolaricaulaceae bacterium]